MSEAAYHKFRHALIPIFDGLAIFSGEMQAALASKQIDALPSFIVLMTGWHQTCYPEWVFRRDFNRHLRAGFRYVLVHLNEVIDAFLSLDYHLHKIADDELLQELSSNLVDAISKNQLLINLITDFFAGKPLDQNHANLTSDITELHNVTRSILPQEVELLDLNTDYIHISAIVHDVVDIRTILLKILTALPIDDLAVSE
jgi:hypothetical protein